MDRKPIQIFLVIAISFAIALSSTYVCYYTVAAADFLSLNLKLEAFDQEYLLAANQSEVKISRSVGFFNRFQPVSCLIGIPSNLFSQILSLDQKTLVLRC
jgi:hypothetical protein